MKIPGNRNAEDFTGRITYAVVNNCLIYDIIVWTDTIVRFDFTYVPNLCTNIAISGINSSFYSFHKIIIVFKSW
ncbi:hypothetical protein, partial [Butyrivibrio fibrisolvens]|uniref:hypothetical protein n=1 Tax=Butyrivibrio fibrisolvens TaxID=831 RepID=UPI0005598B68